MKDQIIAQLTLGSTAANADEAWYEAVEEALDLWFGSMQRNGQILGEPVCGIQEQTWMAYVRLPARDALGVANCTRYTNRHLESLTLLFGQRPEMNLLAPGNQEWTCGDWHSSAWLVLLGASVDGLGPVRTCELSCIPNYLLPLDADEVERLTFWAKNREHHESIWFATQSLEVETYRALADPLSELNLHAASLAWNLEKIINKPVFTVLFRHYALPDDQEGSRLCPLCGEPWRIQEGDFPYRCEPCRLLGEIAPSGPENGLEWIGTWEARMKIPLPAERWPDDSGKLAAMLRRGHGEGFLQLLHEAPPCAWALLEDCLRNDPRLDRQVENRDWYYGTLILKTGMPLHRVFRILKHVPEDELLILEVIGWLNGQNVPGAFEVLLGEMQRRENWQDVLPHITTVENAKHAQAICSVMEERFPLTEDLAAALPDAWLRNAAVLKPFEDHKEAIIRDALLELTKQDQEHNRQRDLFRTATAPQSLHELIQSCQSMADAFKQGRFAAAKAKIEDAEWLVSQLSHDHPARSVAALIALKPIMSDALFEPVLSYFIEGISQNMQRAVSIRCRNVLLSVSPQKLLPIGREWIHSSSSEQYTLARRILSLHAEVHDIPLLRQLLSEGLTSEEERLHLVCDCLEAFSHFPGIGVIDEVTHAYHRVRYSYGRHLAVKAMHMICPSDFQAEHAHECLYDCEEETRKIAQSCLASVRDELV